MKRIERWFGLPVSGARAATLAGVVAVASLLVVPAPAPAARYLYASNNAYLGVDGFAQSADGALGVASGSPTATAANTNGIVVDPAARHLYVASGLGVYAFNIDRSTGALTEIAGSPFAAGGNPYGIAINPSGTRLYAMNVASSNISAFAIAASGELTPISGSPFAAAAGVRGAVLDPAGEHLYAISSTTNNINAYDIDADGALSPVAGSPYAMTFGPYGISIDPAGEHLFVAGGIGQGWVGVYDINAAGALAEIAGSPYAAAANSRDARVDPSGSHLYVSNQSSASVSGFRIDSATGALTSMGSAFATGTGPMGISPAPDDRYVYVASSTLKKIYGYSVDGSSGALTQIAGPTFSTSGNSSFLAITPDQSPVPRFTSSSASAATFAFDASASSYDGVARYDWNFGDGTTASDAGATTSHTYAAPGSYTVRLTLSNGYDCTGSQVWAGRTAFCNGASPVSTTGSVVVAGGSSDTPTSTPSLTISDLKLRPAAFIPRSGGSSMRVLAAKRSAKKRGTKKRGTTASFRLSEAATTMFSFQRKVKGRRARGRCLTGSKAPKKGRRCSTYVNAGKLSFAGRAGANRVWLAGRVGGRRLRPGIYRLTATARAGSRASTQVTKRFRILRSRR